MTSTAARAGRPGPAARAWRAARTWRRARPFWGGLLTILSGVEIASLPLAPLPVMAVQGVAGVPTLLMGAGMVMLGLAIWFSPTARTLACAFALLLSLAALVLSNLGGLLLGTFLGIIGAAWGYAWVPLPAGVEEGAAGGQDASAPPRQRQDPPGG